MASPTIGIRTRQTELTKESILEALVRVVSERGVDDFSIKRVAGEAGVTHRTVYNYFPSRQALLEGLGEYLQQRFVPVLQTRDGQVPEDVAPADLPALYEASYRGFEQHREAIAAFVTLAMGARVIDDRIERGARLRRILAGHTAHLEPRDAEAAIAILRGVGSSTLWHHIRRHHPDTDSEALARAARWAAETLIRDLAAGGGPTMNKEDE